MVGVLNIDIQESEDELRALLAKQSTAEQRSKVQVLWWLKSNQANQVNQLAELSGCHRTTISRWLSRYRRGGMSALLEIKPKSGRPRHINNEIRAQLAEALKDPEGFQSYQEVQQWLKTNWGLDVPYKTVHQTVRYGLKAKLKRTRPVSDHQ